MMEKLNAKSTLVAVPSLSLIKQTLDVYLKEVVARNLKVKWLCICSDEGIGKNDDILFRTSEIGVPCTTRSELTLKEWLKTQQKGEHNHLYYLPKWEVNCRGKQVVKVHF